MVTNQIDYRRRYFQRLREGTLDENPTPQTPQPVVRPKSSPQLGPDGKPLTLAQKLGLAPVERPPVQPPIAPPPAAAALPPVEPTPAPELPPEPSPVAVEPPPVEQPVVSGDNVKVGVQSPSPPAEVDPLTGTPLNQ